MHFFQAMLLGGTRLSVAPIREFGHFLEISFEANLAYSIVIRLGNLAGASISRWIERERIRVIPALSESTQFNEITFTNELERVRDKYQGYIRVLNMICVTWAIVAASMDVILLMLLPFHPDAQVDLIDAIEGTAILFGAVPVGIIGLLIFNHNATEAMREDSKVFDKMIDILEKAPAEKVKAARDALLKRIADERVAAQIGR